MSVESGNYVIIFRRFVRRNGRLLDAWKYGHRVWPIRILQSERWPGQLEFDF